MEKRNCRPPRAGVCGRRLRPSAGGVVRVSGGCAVVGMAMPVVGAVGDGRRAEVVVAENLADGVGQDVQAACVWAGRGVSEMI